MPRVAGHHTSVAQPFHVGVDSVSIPAATTGWIGPTDADVDNSEFALQDLCGEKSKHRFDYVAYEEG